ncbi:hypothetical protein GXB85_14675 [Cellulomonas sp. APG4]|uniref:hypothetical protein n=1 Tax=Cellulomonas sp. APG4 TaxID=1538656 RepID=UPI00137A5CD9|nr:hypothetical protein [Cellulomonas sp. APG4]NCT92186.1 hypothetical protein [Cellulomonas sp. APG4]
MGRVRKRSGPISATELMDELGKDEGYQEKRAVFEAELRERTEVLRVAEQPIVADLRAAGIDVESVWDLVNTSEPYPAALPVLLRHLERGGYPDRVMESMGRALAVKPTVTLWDRLKALYLAPRSAGEQEGAAVALAASATDAQIGDLIAFLSMEERGASRVYFVRPILALGGDRGRQVLEGLRGDPALGKEASALLSGRK